MARKSWQLDRRTFLMGAGASLALPWLECMTTVNAMPAKAVGLSASRDCRTQDYR